MEGGTPDVPGPDPADPGIDPDAVLHSTLTSSRRSSLCFDNPRFDEALGWQASVEVEEEEAGTPAVIGGGDPP